MHSRPLRLALQLGLFQLSLGILGVLILGLLNRLLIQDIQVPAVLAAVAVGGQQLMGFTRAWFGHRSDRIPVSRLRRTPFIISSTVAIALLFGVACQLVLRLAASMEDSGGELNALLMGLLILVLVGIGTAIAAGGTAFSALIADRTTEAERPLLLLGLGVVSVFGVERCTTGLMLTAGPVPPRCPSAVGFAPVVVATAHHPPGWPLPRGAVPVHLQHFPQRCGA